MKLKQGLTDYINANFVQIPTINRKYILTQVEKREKNIFLLMKIFFEGPLQTTSNHFWQMVWEQNSRVIVMLTRLIEKGCVSSLIQFQFASIFVRLLFFIRVNVGYIILIKRTAMNSYLMMLISK